MQAVVARTATLSACAAPPASAPMSNEGVATEIAGSLGSNTGAAPAVPAAGGGAALLAASSTLACVCGATSRRGDCWLWNEARYYCRAWAIRLRSQTCASSLLTTCSLASIAESTVWFSTRASESSYLQTI